MILTRAAFRGARAGRDIFLRGLLFAMTWPSLQLELVHELADGGRRLVEGRLLLAAQLDLDDLLDAGTSQLHGHADVETFGPVLPVEIRGAREDLLLVLQDGLDHLHRGGGGSVVRAAALEEAHNLRAA